MMSVTLTGGSPWGFSIKGGKDFHLPLTISKVTPGGKADQIGVPEGYVIKKVNGQDTTNMSHHEALILIKHARPHLQIHISKPEVKKAPVTTSNTASQSHLQINSTGSKTNYNPSTYNVSNNQYSQPPQSARNLSNSNQIHENGRLNDKPVIHITEDMKNMIFDRNFSDETFAQTSPSPVQPRHHNSYSATRSSYQLNKGSQPSNYYIEDPKQSPSLYLRTESVKKTPVQNGDKATLIINPDMKKMIFDDDNDDSYDDKNRSRYNSRWQSQNHRSPTETASNKRDRRYDNHKFVKSEAAKNIGKFIESSNYGKPVFAKSLLNQVGTLYEPLVLEVRLGADLPVPSVNWYHNNRTLRESRDKDVTILSNGLVHTVVLGELRSDMLGTYSCTITNKYGSQSCHCHVTAEHDQHHRDNSIDSSSTVSTASITRRIISSSSMDLYSPRTVQETIHDQYGKAVTTPRSSIGESEVVKVLNEDFSAPRFHRKTPSMKLLEDSLISDSVDL